MAHELISISPHTSGGGFDVNFRNDTVSIPDDPGGYAISTGCGSGKTESIKSLIRLKLDDGILYCVDTISECGKMRDWILSELVSTGVMAEDDLLMLTSQSTTLEMKPYLDNPGLICQKKVLILTHARFWSDIIDYFLRYPIPPTLAFDGDFRKLMTGGGIRKYIVFDETPLMLKPFMTLTKGQIAPYAEMKGGVWRCKPIRQMLAIYNKFIKDDISDYHHGKNRLTQIKNEVCLNLISKNFDAVCSDKKHKIHGIHWYPIQLVQQGMSSWVLIYEGVADVLLGSSKALTLLDIKQKYNTLVNFLAFDFSLTRKKLPSDNEYESLVGDLSVLLNGAQGQTLIVIWRDFKPERSETLGKGSTWTSRLTDALVEKGFPSDSFAVTYYGASDTKSTNVYRDFMNVILVGKWTLVKSVTETLKKAYDCDATLEDYMLWYYTQLLCRIGIRKGDGQQYNIWYSNDYDPDFIKKLELYIGHNLWVKQKQTVQPLWELMVEDLCRQQYKERIEKLISYDPFLKDAIEKSVPYICNISLNDIANIIPMGGKKQKRNYRSLVTFLEKLGITLMIT